MLQLPLCCSDNSDIFVGVCCYSHHIVSYTDARYLILSCLVTRYEYEVYKSEPIFCQRTTVSPALLCVSTTKKRRHPQAKKEASPPKIRRLHPPWNFLISVHKNSVIFKRVTLEIALESLAETSGTSSNLNRQRGAQLSVYIGNKTKVKTPKKKLMGGGGIFHVMQANLQIVRCGRYK